MKTERDEKGTPRVVPEGEVVTHSPERPAPRAAPCRPRSAAAPPPWRCQRGAQTRCPRSCRCLL